MPRLHRTARHRFGHVEQLETRRLLAVDLVAPLADVTVPAGSPAAIIDLAAAFNLVDVTGSVVRLTNNIGSDIYAELFDAAGPERDRTTPATVANFLAYVDAGRYTDSAIHRSVQGFVVQGGGFTVTDDPMNLFDPIPQFAPVINEPGNTNVRGTIAMAKLGGDPNSATNQFFFNLGDNSANLDNQNGGFTVFGRVLGDGMTVVDTIAGLPRFNFGSPFDELPTIGLDDPADLARENVVTITGVTRVGELVFTAMSSDPSVATATVGPDGNLSIAYAAEAVGEATITVRATSVFDPTDFREEEFTVTVTAPDPNPPPPPVIVTGSDVGPGSRPWVTVIDPTSGAIISRFLAYEPSFRGGVRVALGDVVGDGTEQIITAPGPGRVGEVRVFRQDGTELVAYRSLPFSAGYRGGVEVAAGDVNGDGTADIVTSASRGPGLVNVFFISPDAPSPIPSRPSVSFRAFPARFNGGATVATADVGTFTGGSLTNANAPDGRMEIIVGSGPGMAPRVLVYDLSGSPRVVRTITPFNPRMRGGVSVSAGRYNADPIDDIIVAGGFHAGSQIEVYSGLVAPGQVRLATQQAFAALGRSNLPVYAAAIARTSDGQMEGFAVVQGGGRTQQGVRRIGVPVAIDTSLTNLPGPLRITASRPS